MQAGTASFDTNDSDESTFNFNVTAEVLSEPVALKEIGLFRDTGTVALTTYNPILSGLVVGDYQGNDVEMWFDHDSDHSVYETPLDVPDTERRFFYDPRDNDPTLDGYVGSVDIYYCLVEVDAASVPVSPPITDADWTLFSYTLEAVPESYLSVSSLELVDDTGPSSYDNVTSDPTLSASVYLSDQQALVEFEVDGVSKDTRAVDPDQSHAIYVPTLADLTLDIPSTIRARVIEWDDDGQMYLEPTSWSDPIEIMLVLPEDSAPDIDSLALEEDTGDDPTDAISTNVTLVGQLDVPDDENWANVRIEFDHSPYNGIDDVDGWTVTDASGDFMYLPVGIPANEWFTLGARAIIGQDGGAFDNESIGNATSYSFKYETDPLPAIRLLELESPKEGTTDFTETPVIQGQLEGEENIAGVEIEIDHDGDVGRTRTDSGGRFSYYIAGLWPGVEPITVRAKAVRWDDVVEDYLSGEQILDFVFTLEAPTNDPPTVDTLELAIDTGIEDDLQTTDATLTGQLANDGATSYLTVEFDHDGNGLVDGTSRTDWLGNFRYEPRNLADGEQTITARGVEWGYGLSPISAVLDDTSVTYEEIANTDGSPGTWSDITTLGYQGAARLLEAGEESVARWTFDGLKPGTAYHVYVTWVDASDRTTAAPYNVYDGETLLTTSPILVDQTQAANDNTFDNASWELLSDGSISSFATSGRSLTVELSAASSGRVVADAVRLVEMPRLLDDGDTGFTAELATNWTPVAAGHDGDALSHAAGSGTDVARWTFDALAPGLCYEVFVTWPSGADRSAVAPYQIIDDTTLESSLTVDQRIQPQSETVDGTAWQSLGIVRVDEGTLHVELGSADDGLVMADAVRLVRVPVLVGDWLPITFQYTAPFTPAPTIETLGLWSDTGPIVDYTANPMLYGSLVDDDYLLTGLTIEFDHDAGDGIDQRDGVAFADAEGLFHYDPVGLTPGEHVVRARATRWDNQTQAWLIGPSLDVTFHLENQTNLAPILHEVSLADNQGTPETPISTTKLPDRHSFRKPGRRR